jgi:hypothetical protein
MLTLLLLLVVLLLQSPATPTVNQACVMLTTCCTRPIAHVQSSYRSIPSAVVVLKQLDMSTYVAAT